MSLGKKMFSGMMWSAVDRLGMQVVQFVLNLILARLLTPDDYGTVGILLVFIAISRVFIESGIPTALIQKKDRKQVDISTSFVFNTAVSLFCYILLFFAAPYIADFYEVELLTILLRIIALSLVVNALYIIPSTLLTIDLDFKSLAKINFTATLLSGLLAIWLAYEGYGVWALAWQTLSRSVLNLLLMWYFTKWKISVQFSMESFKGLFKFGSNLLASALLARAVSDVSSLVIGKVNSTADLGVFTRGRQFADFFSATINAIINRVLLPGMNDLQDKPEVLKAKFRKIIQLTSLVSFPIFFGLAAIADPLIRVVLGEKWIEAILIMQIFCFNRLITIFCSINLNILLILGKSNLVLRQQYWAIGTRVLFVGLSLKHGIYMIALAELVSTFSHLYINSYYPSRFIQYPFLNQIKDMAVYLLLASVMGAVSYFSLMLIDDNILKLIVSISLGATTYIILTLLFRRKDVAFIRQLIK